MRADGGYLFMNAAVIAAIAVSAASAQCPMEWSPGFESPQIEAYALGFWDDGRGPALYVGGLFDEVAGVAASNIVRWDGRRWEPLGAGTNRYDEVHALTPFDDGSGPALYVGGRFRSAGGVDTGCIARWDGMRWSRVGGGIRPGTVYAMLPFDDGSGPALYAAGQFTTAGGISVHNFARWNGNAWSDVGGGFTGGEAMTMALFDDGRGPALYAGGWFDHAGSAAICGLARWSGTAWADVAGSFAIGEGLFALTVFDDGSGPVLYAGGNFAEAGATPARNIARWDGVGWSALADGVDYTVKVLQTFDDGHRATLYAGGEFRSANGLACPGLAMWNGQQWSTVADGPQTVGGPYPDVRALLGCDVDGRHKLYVAADNQGMVLNPFPALRTWDGGQWGEVGHGLLPPWYNNSLGGTGLGIYDAGNGPALYLAGSFEAAGAVAANKIAKWNSAGWEPLGAGLRGLPGRIALASFDAGGGAELYVAGDLDAAGALQVRYIARWNGTRWAALSAAQFPDMPIWALKVFDDGSGPGLYAGGRFWWLGNNNYTVGVARWDGVQWHDVGGGLRTDTEVFALERYDDGTGPALYVAGDLAGTPEVTSPGIIRWNGQRWSAVGQGAPPEVDPRALGVYDDGTGPALYLGAAVRVGHPSSALFRWNGQSWDPIGPMFEYSSGYAYRVNAMNTWNDGRGPALFVTGYFATEHPLLARWDGTTWTWLGRPPIDEQFGWALLPFDDGNGPALFVGAACQHLGDTLSLGIGRWQCVPGGRAGDLNCDGHVDFEDINPFVLALSDPAGYAVQFSGCLILNGDCNGDGLMNFGDITAFVRMLPGE